MIDALQVTELWSRYIATRAPVFSQRSSVFDQFAFSELTDDAKCQLAAHLLLDTSPQIGAFAGNQDTFVFLEHVSTEFRSWPQGKGFAGRRLENVAYALSLIAGSESFARPPGALAASYLVHQLEFLFRVLGKHLDVEGKFVDSNAKADAQQRLGISLGNRVNDIEKTYRIMRLSLTVTASRAFGFVDSNLPPTTLADGSRIENVGQRVAYFRHPVAHGPLADPSSEGPFYALLVAIAAYGSTVFDRT